jgi:hypothetical protein
LTRCGARPRADQIRCTVAGDTPARAERSLWVLTV